VSHLNGAEEPDVADVVAAAAFAADCVCAVAAFLHDIAGHAASGHAHERDEAHPLMNVRAQSARL